jgi:hypothetical protein
MKGGEGFTFAGQTGHDRRVSGGPSYREAKGGDVHPQPFCQARYYDFKLWI